VARGNAGHALTASGLPVEGGRMGEAAKGAGSAASLFDSGKAAAQRRTRAVNECALMDAITARRLKTCMT
jgi:hypothetical protein